jgi:ATP-dependent Clp protease adapter protein ClpS
MSASGTFEVMKSITDQIDSIGDGWIITVLNNNVTPFEDVQKVLKNIVPMSEIIAYQTTLLIHKFGEATVYKGNIDHCEKIKTAFIKIGVDTIISKS